MKKKIVIVVVLVLLFFVGFFVGKLFKVPTVAPEFAPIITPTVTEVTKAIATVEEVSVKLVRIENKIVSDKSEKVTKVVVAEIKEIPTTVTMTAVETKKYEPIFGPDRIEIGAALNVFKVPSFPNGRPLLDFEGMQYYAKINQKFSDNFRGTAKISVGVGDASLSTAEFGLSVQTPFVNYKMVAGLEISGGWALVNIDTHGNNVWDYRYNGSGPVVSVEGFVAALWAFNLNAKFGVGYSYSPQTGRYHSTAGTNKGNLDFGGAKFFVNLSSL